MQLVHYSLHCPSPHAHRWPQTLKLILAQLQTLMEPGSESAKRSL